MGPRPRGRGIVLARREPLAREVASMGPRPRGRGIALGRFGYVLGDVRFNGAATARSRNSPRVITDPPRRVALQWGRDRAVAELPAGKLMLIGNRLASMGPRPRGRGIAAQVIVPQRAELLQWGRDRAVAELRQDGRVVFHGERASMGPRPRGRGIVDQVRVQPVLEVASMGPRPRGRGIGGPRCPPDEVVLRFNGAATARSRN